MKFRIFDYGYQHKLQGECIVGCSNFEFENEKYTIKKFLSSSTNLNMWTAAGFAFLNHF